LGCGVRFSSSISGAPCAASNNDDGGELTRGFAPKARRERPPWWRVPDGSAGARAKRATRPRPGSRARPSPCQALSVGDSTRVPAVGPRWSPQFSGCSQSARLLGAAGYGYESSLRRPRWGRSDGRYSRGTFGEIRTRVRKPEGIVIARCALARAPGCFDVMWGTAKRAPSQIDPGYGWIGAIPRCRPADEVLWWWNSMIGRKACQPNHRRAFPAAGASTGAEGCTHHTLDGDSRGGCRPFEINTEPGCWGAPTFWFIAPRPTPPSGWRPLQPHVPTRSGQHGQAGISAIAGGCAFTFSVVRARTRHKGGSGTGPGLVRETLQPKA